MLVLQPETTAVPQRDTVVIHWTVHRFHGHHVPLWRKYHPNQSPVSLYTIWIETGTDCVRHDADCW